MPRSLRSSAVKSASPAPLERLIDAQGQPQWGIFPQPVRLINYADYDYRTPMGGKVNRLWKHFKPNQFQFIGVLSPELVMGCAIVDLKVLSNAFLYLYHPPTQTLKEYSFIHPLGWNTQFPPTPDEGTTSFASLGQNFAFKSSFVPRQREVHITLRSGERLDFTLSEESPLFQPLAICTQAGYTGWVYTQKAAGLPVRGTITWEKGTVDLEKIGAMACYDWTCGFMRRETFWNWGCLAGRLPDGRTLGLNVAAGVNETGFTENGFWVDGKFYKLDTVSFEYQRQRPTEPWHLRSFDGRLNLQFQPEGKRAEKLDLGLLATNFTQFFGKFHGTLQPEGSQPLVVEGLYGFVEDHFARW